MGKIYDLTSKLSEEKDIIKIGDEQYEINNSLKTMFSLDALGERLEKGEISNIEFLKEFFAISLGEDGANKLFENNYSSEMTTAIMETIKASLAGGNAGNSENA